MQQKYDGIVVSFSQHFSDLTHLPVASPPCLRLDTVLGQLKELDRQRCEAKNLLGFWLKKAATDRNLWIVLYIYICVSICCRNTILICDFAYATLSKFRGQQKLWAAANLVHVGWHRWHGIPFNAGKSDEKWWDAPPETAFRSRTFNGSPRLWDITGCISGQCFFS